MSMRYLIRRSNSQDFSDIREKVPDLDQQLGDPSVLVGPQSGLHRSINVVLSPTTGLQYTFLSKKTEAGQQWECASLELVAETEKELRQMAEEYKVADKLGHLKS